MDIKNIKEITDLKNIKNLKEITDLKNIKNIKELTDLKNIKVIRKKPEIEKHTNSGDLFDYVLWRGDLTFRQSPPNAVDALIFSVLAYIDFRPVLKTDPQPTLKEALNQLMSQKPEEYIRWISHLQTFTAFTELVAASRRFRHVKIRDCAEKFNSDIDMQFAAVTFQLPTNTLFIAFRGTDNTLTGWKEDFNMAFLNATPAQLEAQRYTAEIAAQTKEPLILGGHSKGGNLAVWAGVNCGPRCRQRIRRIYNLDGPGFTPEFLKGERFQQTESKILSFVPESSIVGVLLCTCDYVTIKSSNASVFQHDPFSWQIIGRHFVYGTDRSRSGKQLEQAINSKLSELTDAEKSLLVEKIFAVLEEENVKTTDDIKENPFKSLLVTLPKLIAGIKQL